MNFSNATVKITAKSTLKNKYTSGIITAAIFVFAYIVCYYCGAFLYSLGSPAAATISLICLFAFLILPLIAGYVYWGVRLAFFGENEPVLMFKYFSSKENYLKALKFSFLITGNGLFVGFLLSLPCILVSLIASGKLFVMLGLKIPLWASSFDTVRTVFVIAAILLFFLIMLKYYLAPFLMAADEDMDPLEAVHMSKIISVRSKRNFLWLILGFLPHIIACVFVIPIIFLFPYFNLSYVVYCRFAVAAYNISVDKTNKANIPSFDADISF